MCTNIINSKQRYIKIYLEYPSEHSMVHQVLDYNFYLKHCIDFDCSSFEV